jgi:hypothetical protein
VLQSDYQTFLAEKPPGVVARDTFVVRFAGMQMDALIHDRFHSQILVDFSQSQVALYDAWLEALLFPELRLRVGQFQFPISEERLTPGISLPFVSPAFASFLLPSSDIGVQAYGTIAGDVLRYNVALTNGAYAGTLSEVDVDSQRDVIARAFARPFVHTELAPIRKLGIGVGASYGVHTGTTENPELPILRTYGGQTFFSYRNDKTPAGTAIAAGSIYRLVPHATWAWGPVAAYADWVRVRERVNGVDVTSDAYSVVSSVVLTGEDAEPLAYVIPKRPVDRGGIGTLLLAAGAGRIRVGNNAFASGAADPATSMQEATVIGGGFNWYPLSGIAVFTSFGHMVFESYGGGPARRPENTLIARFQMVL